ncbi:MAG: hypothetical protein PHD95_03730 [Candidatus ainarchaeum sp.]|nr:hypothetical protein [Candidatus ainarchaeum sp.]
MNSAEAIHMNNGNSPPQALYNKTSEIYSGEQMFEESSYFVELSKNPQKAIEIALQNPTFERTENEEKTMKDYLDSKCLLSIRLLERACRINAQDKFIPIQYQQLWVCLNKTRIQRNVANKRIVKPLVAFHSVCLEPKDNLVGLVNDALKLVGTKTELAKLCNVKHRQLIYFWTKKQGKIQLLALIKICQLLDKDIWQEIDDCKLYGHCAPEEEAITFHNYPRRELLDLLIWIKLEGHIALSQPRVETCQRKGAECTLEKIKEKFVRLYKMNPKVALIYDNSIHKGTDKDWDGYKLSISSAPLRQTLVLQYNMQPGYKCKDVEISDEINACKNDEDKKQIFATILETEGSFFPENRDKQFPRIAASSLSKKFRDQASKLGTELGYRIQKVNCDKGKNTDFYDFRINYLTDTIKCFYDVLPYISHPIKKSAFLKIIENKEFLHCIKLQNNTKIKSLIKSARAKCSNNMYQCNKALVQKIEENKKTMFKYKRHNVNGWLRGKAVPLQAIIEMCRITKQDFFEYMPECLSLILLQNKYISNEKYMKLLMKREIYGL